MRLFEKKKEINTESNYLNRRRFILSDKSNFAVTEAYKTLRTNVHFVLRGTGCKKFCITSGGTGEGKSITTLNLAISFAQMDKKVLLIDADMRRPSMARLLAEKAAPGLSNVLAGLIDEKDAICRERFPNLDVLFSGEVPPNPSELLQSSEMGQLIERLSKKYDYILVDTSPIGMVSDACVVASLLDGVLFLVRKNQVERDAVNKGVKQLELAGANIMGFVLNGSEEQRRRNYYYRRSNYYGYRKTNNEEEV